MIGERRRDRIDDVHTDAQRQPLQRLTLPAPLAEGAGELAAALPDHDVIGPLEPRQWPAGALVHHVREHEPRAQGKRAQIRLLRTEQHAEPNAAGRRVPGAPVAAPPGRLLLGEHDGTGRRALGAELVDHVEAGGESREHAALRHSPALGETSGGHPIQL